MKAEVAESGIHFTSERPTFKKQVKAVVEAPEETPQAQAQEHVEEEKKFIPKSKSEPAGREKKPYYEQRERKQYP